MGNKLIRTMVRGTYDVQKLRISTGNRLVGNFKAKLGLPPSAPEEEMDSEGKKILADLRVRYKKITDGVKVFPREKDFKGDEVISNYTELCLISQYLDLEKHEEQHFARFEDNLRQFPIYTQYLEGVRGVGPAMSGVIISEFDIHKAKYVSSMWAYAGVDVAGDGAGRSKRKEHLVKKEYTNREGEVCVRDSITFNPFLKAKLLGVLSGSFLRVKDSAYAQFYYNYKTRMENHAKWGVHNDKEKGENGKPFTSRLRRHRQALRYMVKMFLIDLYKAWRKIEGLPVYNPYAEDKLGRKHGEDGPSVAS